MVLKFVIVFAHPRFPNLGFENILEIEALLAGYLIFAKLDVLQATFEFRKRVKKIFYFVKKLSKHGVPWNANYISNNYPFNIA